MMRIATILMGLGASVLMCSTALAGDRTYNVELNKTELLRLPAAASAVIIGNPNIADVSVHAANTVFIVGRGFGETNLIVLDASGATMMNADIQVINTVSHQGVRVFNAKSRETYNCQPYCQPSPILGDSPEFIENNSAESNDIDPLTALFNAASKSAAQSASRATPARSQSDTGFSGPPN